MAGKEQRLAIVVVAKDLASRTLRGINSQLALMGKGSAIGQIGRGFGTLAAGLTRVGVIAAGAAVGGIVAAAKAGMDFQDAFAGVRKTVEGTPEQINALYRELRQLALRIPVKFTDLAELAQTAGALGVPVNDVGRFTEVVSRVVAGGTGLNINEVADAFGKLGNILHVHGSDYERMGSALVQLGNTAASTEGEIVSVARRFAGAGAQAKLSAAQVLGWSSAISSVGVLPEAGGSALSRLFNNMTRFAATGDAKLKGWAATAKLSIGAFTKLVHDDANGAMLLFLKNLSKLDRFQVSRVLANGGIRNVRDINAILLLSQNYDLLTDSLKTATDAYNQNTALATASGKRFDTLKAHLTEFKNAILDAAVTISEGMNPAIDRALQKLRAFLLLPTTQSDLKKLGQDIGDAIDSINWEKVLAGARTLVNYAKTILDVIRQIPVEITAGVAAFGGLNKLSGGLIGKGIGEIVGGAIRVSFSQFAARGSSAANPVWVQSATGAGGILPGKGESKWMTLLKGLFILPLVAEIADALHEPLTDLALSINKATGLDKTPLADIGKWADDLSWPFGSKDTPKWVIDTPFGPWDVWGGRHKADEAPTVGPSPFGPTHDPTSWGPGGIVAMTPVTKALDVLHQDFLTQLGILRKSTDPAAIAAAATAAALAVTKGAGNVHTTKGLLADLRAKYATATDPAEKKALAAAIQAVEKKLPGREWIAAQEADARKIVASNEPISQKLAELTGIQRAFTARGDTVAAGIIVRAIQALGGIIAGMTFGSAGDMGRGPGPEGRPITKFHDVNDRNPRHGFSGNVIVPLHLTVTHSAADSFKTNKRYHRVGNGSAVSLN